MRKFLRRYFLFFPAVFLLGATSLPPQKVAWKTLEDVVFTKKWDDKEGMYVLYPAFGKSVLALQHKEIYLTGYVIPVDYNENFYVLSAFPYSACFFCGGAGPESVVSLKFAANSRRFKTDEKLSFKGTLKLNDQEVYELNYILENASLYDPK